MSLALADITDAAERLAGVAIRTPLLESPALNERLGARVLIKAETLQRIGAFKFRGAYNRLCRLDETERRAGVVAFSSGNHAQGVALAARLLGIPATIVMPADAPAVKMAATKALGAEVRPYDRARESREAIAESLARRRGAVLVPSFDDRWIIAGQGTCGLEIVEQAASIGADLELVAAPVGGGGLLAGVATAIKHNLPNSELWGVEPEGFDDTRLSLGAGERRGSARRPATLCDALESAMPGALTFPVLAAHLAGVAVVTNAEVARAMRVAFATLKLVVEPGGAVALAALLSGALPCRGRTVAIILSGGNVDPELFARVLRKEV